MPQATSLPSQALHKSNAPQIRPEELSQLAGLFAAKLKAGLSISQALYALSVEFEEAGSGGGVQGREGQRGCRPAAG